MNMNLKAPTYKKSRATSGFTIVEGMVAAAVTVIIAIGSLGYQYYSVKHSRASQAQIMATRIAQLLLEDWKSTNADAIYNPTTLGLGFLSTSPGDYGQYLITLHNQTFYTQLTAVDIAEDTVAGVKLRQINVTIRWRRNFCPGAISANDPTISLTTYVRSDED